MPVPPTQGDTLPGQPETVPSDEELPEGETERELDQDAEAEDDCEDCPQCPPREEGQEVTRTINATGSEVGAHASGYSYQHQICPWHAYNPPTSINEWEWSGSDWDGLHPAQCQLYETKYGYDSNLETNDWSASGRPTPRTNPPFRAQILAGMISTIRVRVGKVAPHKAEVAFLVACSSSTTSVYVRSVIWETDGNWWVSIQHIAAAGEGR